MATQYHLKCDGCNNVIYFVAAEFGDTVDCEDCGLSLTLPDSHEAYEELINTPSVDDGHLGSHTHYRVMLRGEDGTLSCLKNGVPAEYADLVAEGLQTHYTEGQRVFLEPEETLADLHRMCRGRDYEDFD